MKLKKQAIIDKNDGTSKYHNNRFRYYSFQPDAVKFLTDRKRAILALPTGTGKTLVSLSAYAHLKESNPKLKLIFVTDKSVVIQAHKTVENYFTLKSEYIYGHYKGYRLKTYKNFIENKFDILILNYAMLRADVDEFQDMFYDIGGENIVLICDEANYVAGITSTIHTIVYNMAQEVAYCYFLTATVSKGKLEDYFNLVRCLGETDLSVQDFMDEFGEVAIALFTTAKYINNKAIGVMHQSADNLIVRIGLVKMLGDGNYTCPQPTASKTVIKNNIVLTLPKDRWDAPRVANSAIKVYDTKSGRTYKITLHIKAIYKMVGYKNIGKFVQRFGQILYSKSKKEIAPHLPDFTKKIYQVEEDKATHNAMRMLYAEYNGEPKHSQLNICLTYPAYADESLKEHQNEKIKKLLDILDNDIPDDEKVIIYHTSKTVINFVYDILKDKYKCNRITGDIVKEREQEKTEFITTGKVLLITDAGGVGVDSLQVSNNIIFLGMPTTGGQLAQLAGRISRINTVHTKLTLFFILTDNTYDSDKYSAVMSQINLMHSLDANSIDGGLKDIDVKAKRTEEEADIFIKESIWSRRNQYLGKK